MNACLLGNQRIEALTLAERVDFRSGLTRHPPAIFTTRPTQHKLWVIERTRRCSRIILQVGASGLLVLLFGLLSCPSHRVRRRPSLKKENSTGTTNHTSQHSLRIGIEFIIGPAETLASNYNRTGQWFNRTLP